MNSDNSYKSFILHSCLLRIMDHLKSLHYDECHWLYLKELSGGVYFQTDWQRQTLKFRLCPDIRVEIEVHPSGRSSTVDVNIDNCAQVLSIRAWYPNLDDPVVYKWEYGNPCKLKKEDEDWITDINMLNALERALEDIMKSYNCSF